MVAGEQQDTGILTHCCASMGGQPSGARLGTGQDQSQSQATLVPLSAAQQL